MATSVTWNSTVYSVPAAGETGWSSLSNFLIALANTAQTTNKSLSGMRTATSTPVTVAAATDYTVLTDLTIAGAVAVTLPAGVNGQIFVIADGKGDAATNNITVSGTAQNIDDASTFVINRNFGGAVFQYSSTDTQWHVISQYSTVATATAATSTVAGVVTTFVPVIISAVKTVSSANYTILDADGYEEILVSTGASNRTITLPAAATNAGRRLSIVKSDSGVGGVVIDGNASETIDGATTQTLFTQYGKVTIFCNGSNWFATSPISETGAYTPTVSATVNIDNTSVGQCNFVRTGAYVFISGNIAVNITAGSSTATSMRITIPITSAFAAGDDAAGTFVREATTLQYEAGKVSAVGSTALLTFVWNAVDTANNALNFTVMYKII